MRTGVALATAAATLAGCAGIGAASASAAPSPLRLWRVSRTGSGAAPLGLDVRVTTTATDWLILVVEVDMRGVRRASGDASVAEPNTEPVVYDATAGVTRPCGTACRSDGAGRQDMAVDDASSGGDYFVAVRGGSAVVTLRTRGWRARVVAPTALRSVAVDGVRATGAAVGPATVERFTHVSAPGGRYGSFAWLSLACGLAGVGSATLAPTPRRTGDTAGTASCGPRAAAPASSGRTASSPGGATWRADGDATGVGYGPTRLLVLDFPRV